MTTDLSFRGLSFVTLAGPGYSFPVQIVVETPTASSVLPEVTSREVAAMPILSDANLQVESSQLGLNSAPVKRSERSGLGMERG